MSQRRKLYDKLGSKPTPTDIFYSDILSLLIYVGFKEIYCKGDHIMFKHSVYGDIKVSLDSNSKRAIKACYVKNVYNAITEVMDRGDIEL